MNSFSAAIDVVLVFYKAGIVRLCVLGERGHLRLPGFRRGVGEDGSEQDCE